MPCSRVHIHVVNPTLTASTAWKLESDSRACIRGTFGHTFYGGSVTTSIRMTPQRCDFTSTSPPRAPANAAPIFPYRFRHGPEQKSPPYFPAVKHFLMEIDGQRYRSSRNGSTHSHRNLGLAEQAKTLRQQGASLVSGFPIILELRPCIRRQGARRDLPTPF